MIAQAIPDALNSPDPCALPTLIVLLAIIGSKLVGNRQRLQIWGWRIAAISLLLAGAADALIRAPENISDWTFLVLRSLAVAAIVLGASWILLASAAFVVDHVVKPPLRIVRRRISAAQSRRRQAAEARRLSAEMAIRAQSAERDRVVAQERAVRVAEAARRRTAARAAASLAYSFHAPKLRERYPKEMFDEFVANFFRDDQPPEDVERRSRELVELLQKHAQAEAPAKQPRTFADLTAWYVEQKQLIESLPVDDRMKRTYLAQLNVRYRDLMSSLLEVLRP